MLRHNACKLFFVQQLHKANTDDEDNSTIIEEPGFSGCYGDKGTCGITKNGTILVGKWVEF